MTVTITPGAAGLSPELAFRARLAALGATLLDTQWHGASIKHRIVCALGHEGSPRPSDILNGSGICRVCAGRDPVAASTEFKKKLSELGATLVEPTWLGSNVPHRVLCVAGHECSPRPASVKQGQGICRACVGHDPAMAEAAFRKIITELGATYLESEWLGSNVPHRVICPVGHECSPRPGAILYNGQGICRVCAGKDPVTAEASFRARLIELGATLVEPMWLGSGKSHRVICSAGHECSPSPSHTLSGYGICLTCAGKDPIVAESAFRKRLVELGATLVEPTWLGTLSPHRVICSIGHECSPRPARVQQGEGICRICAGRIWDAFYVVTDVTVGHVKFGITSGDPSPRLQDHRGNGFTEVARLFTDLQGTIAPDLERSIIATLKLAGETPVRGREYFDISTLATILDIVDNSHDLRTVQ